MVELRFAYSVQANLYKCSHVKLTKSEKVFSGLYLFLVFN